MIKKTVKCKYYIKTIKETGGKVKLGIALSGGGIRGIAHAGVLKALEDNHIKIDAIGGTSSGALIAGLYALGYSPTNIYELFKQYSKNIVGNGKNSFMTKITNILKKENAGLKKGENIEELFNVLANEKGIKKISQITKMPITIPTVDIMNGKEYIFTNHIPEEKNVYGKYIMDISMGKALRATSSFPAVFCPCDFDGHKFLDGGALNNVPVIEVKKQGIDKVIAVNFRADDITEKSNYMDIAMRTIDLMGNKISEENLKQSDYILTISTEKTGLLDIQKLDSCYQYGYSTTVNKINEIKEIINQK